jgi:diguanylate cyclase (GGDEF)-like protein
MAGILIVDDDPGTIQILGRALAAEGKARFATNGADAIKLARAHPPDVILLDAEMPHMNGFEVCATLKADPALADIPVIFVSSHRDEAFELAGFDAGAADFIHKPFNPRLVHSRVRAQLRFKHMSDELRKSATVDPLTGVANRRRFDALLRQEWLRARRSNDDLALIMVDIDHFKAYNDRYGHPAGDATLRNVADALKQACLRPGDVVARIGGEEFAVVLPSTSLLGAKHVATRLLDAVEDLKIRHEGSAVAKVVTISVGVASYRRPENSAALTSSEQDPHESPESLIEAADEALYTAKSAGRAQAAIYDVRDTASGELESVPALRVVRERCA